MMTKRKGERGSPWRMPREGEKVLEGTPFTRIEKKTVEVRFSIQFIQSLQKPKAERIDRIYCQLKRSKDFERSSFISIPGVLEDLRE
jgi:hypothetical protein